MLLEALCALLAEDPADELPDPELAEAGAEDGPEEALVDEESPELDPLLEPLFEPLLAPESEQLAPERAGPVDLFALGSDEIASLESLQNLV